MRLDINTAVAPAGRRWPGRAGGRLATACAAGLRSRAVRSDDTLQVVATTTVLADIVANVGGDRVTVRSIIPPGVGPEDYEPKPDDARALDGADLIVSNGVGLDDFLDGLVEANGNDAPRLVLGDGIPTITVDGVPNPHMWLDPTIVAERYVPAIEAKLTEIDPAGAATYRANASGVCRRDRRRWTAELMAEVETIPAASRKLVTFHDAFPYFARHYGFELVGVILGSPGQEPSAGELAALVDTVKAAGRARRLQRGPVQPGPGRDAGRGGGHHEGHHDPV